MTAEIIDGKAFAAGLRARIAERVAELGAGHGVMPGLAVVLVGDDPASAVYVRNKGRATVEAGMRSEEHRLDAATPEAELLALVERLNRDPAVHGILVQLPLPAQIDTNRGCSTRWRRRRTSTASTSPTPGGSRPGGRRWCPARRSAA